MATARSSYIARTISFVIVFCLTCTATQAKYGGGSGTVGDPYQIWTAEQMNMIGAVPNDWDKHFKLVEDIDLSGLDGKEGRSAFNIIGMSYDNAFSGVFDGDGHTIAHLTIEGGGLFGYLGSGAEVTKLGVVDVNIVGEWCGGLVGRNLGTVTRCYSTGTVRGSYVGGLVGKNDDGGSISNCSSSGMVAGQDHVGGLLGSNYGSVTHCYSSGCVNGREDVGGLAGYNWGGNLADCNSTGEVTGYEVVGGLVGYNTGVVNNCSSTDQVVGSESGKRWGILGVGGLVGHNIGRVANCHSSSQVTSDEDVGGLAGYNSGSLIDCYSTGKVTGKSEIGGLVGFNNGDIIGCYSTGVVMGTEWYVGGLVGSNNGSASNCFSMSPVTGTGDCVGGFVGYNSTSSVINCYSTGTVMGTGDYVGGLVGFNIGSVSNCYSTGTVMGTGDYVGGLVGYNHGSGSVSNCFWNMETSGRSSSSGGTGLHTAQMRDILTYMGNGWDFVEESDNGTSEIWQIPDEGGYPELSAFNGYNPLQLRGTGTSDDPYLISTSVELGAIVWYNPKACYRLDANIDLSGITWSTAVIPNFEGTFDGNDLCIRNLTITGGGYLGLFGRLQSGAQVKDLGLVDTNMVGSGVLVGGLGGENFGSVINSYSAGTLRSNSVIGGLLGMNLGSVDKCYSTVAVNGSYVGGLVGINYGSVSNSSNTNKVNGQYCVGGLIGSNKYEGRVSNCCSTGAVTGTTYFSMYAGGLMGDNSGSAVNCYSTSPVSGNWKVGGLIGWNFGTITDCYSTGAVNGNKYVGGLVGSGDANDVVTSFWDTQTSGQVSSAGGIGKRTAEMQTAGTFLEAGWDFVGETANGSEDIWWNDEGNDYPHLWWEATGVTSD